MPSPPLNCMKASSIRPKTLGLHNSFTEVTSLSPARQQIDDLLARQLWLATLIAWASSVRRFSVLFLRVATTCESVKRFAILLRCVLNSTSVVQSVQVNRWIVEPGGNSREGRSDHARPAAHNFSPRKTPGLPPPLALNRAACWPSRYQIHPLQPQSFLPQIGERMKHAIEFEPPPTQATRTSGRRFSLAII
jgi:hypothetical protein